jgi:hypothetical protein
MTGIEHSEAAVRVQEARGLLATAEELGRIVAGEIVGRGISQTENTRNFVDFVVAQREDGQPDRARIQQVVDAYRGIGVTLHTIGQVPADVAKHLLSDRLPTGN